MRVSSTRLCILGCAVLAVACLSQAQALESSPLGLLHGRSLLQTMNCTLPDSALPTYRDPNVEAYIAAAKRIEGYDFIKCANWQCVVYPFLASILPSDISYDTYVSYLNACSSKVFIAIGGLGTREENQAMFNADTVCSGGTFRYRSNENDKKGALSCGGKLKLSDGTGMASCGRGLMQLVVALVAILAVKMMM